MYNYSYFKCDMLTSLADLILFNMTSCTIGIVAAQLILYLETIVYREIDISYCKIEIMGKKG